MAYLCGAKPHHVGVLRLFSFGSGSSGNCLFVDNGRDALLVDAGVGVRTVQRLSRQYGLPMHRLRALLITHDHADHIGAAANVVRRYGMPFYATEAVLRAAALRQHFGRYASLRGGAAFGEVVPGEPLRVASFEVTPFPLPHDATECVGYAIVSNDSPSSVVPSLVEDGMSTGASGGGGHCLVVMTDLGRVTEEVRRYIRRADSLVIEANYDAQMLACGPYPELLKQRISGGTGHLSNAQAAEAIAENAGAGLGTVCLCHLSEHNNTPELACTAVEEAMAARGLRVGTDYALHVLKRREPTGPVVLDKRSTAARGLGGLSACLFDLDGTLIDTEPQYSRVWKAIGERYLPGLTTFHRDIKGTTLTQILSRYFPDPDLQQRISDELDAYEANDMVFAFFPGAVAFVRELRAHGVKTAIVTSSNSRKMDVVMRRLPECRTLFDAVLTSEDFRESKPDPDCFLTATRRLGVSPEECVVFEDAFTGLEAGMRSGMLTVGMATTSSRQAITGRCHNVADSFLDIDYAWVCRQLHQHNQTNNI